MPIQDRPPESAADSAPVPVSFSTLRRDFVVPRPSQLASGTADGPSLDDRPWEERRRPERAVVCESSVPETDAGPWLADLRQRAQPWVHGAAILAVIAVMLALPLTASGSVGAALVNLLTAPAEPPAVAPKVAIIVGPVGAELTPVYITIAEEAAAQASARGATVARAYSPNATPENVLAAMEDANVVVYLGHGVGFPNPYTDTMNPEKVNGFGLQGPNARGDHSDSWEDGTLAYYGESWLTANARPAPGWVMIHSNVCYAPGAGEAFDEPASEEMAIARVANYSRPAIADLGASAYFATDFYMGAAEIIDAMLASPDATYADIFASESRFDATAVTTFAHPLLAENEVWLHRSPYFEGKTDYWYAFAGDPTATPRESWMNAAPEAASPVTAAGAEPVPEPRFLEGVASHYPGDAGWGDQPTVSIPHRYAGELGQGDPIWVVVCAERCASLPVVDTCDCFAGTPEERVINLSHAAWGRVTDSPLDVGLIEVTVRRVQPGAADRFAAPVK